VGREGGAKVGSSFVAKRGPAGWGVPGIQIPKCLQQINTLFVDLRLVEQTLRNVNR